MLQPIFNVDTKLLCPICKNEVNEYPLENMKQDKFICLKCNSDVRFQKHNNKYTAWIINKL